VPCPASQSLAYGPDIFNRSAPVYYSRSLRTKTDTEGWPSFHDKSPMRQIVASLLAKSLSISDVMGGVGAKPYLALGQVSWWDTPDDTAGMRNLLKKYASV
jgi:hypothetical protein